MRRNHTILISALLCGSLMMCSCGKKMQEPQTEKQADTQNEETKGKVKDVLEKAKSENIADTQYENISFGKDFYVDVPIGVTDVSSFTLQHGEKLSNTETKELFDKLMDKYFDGVYSEKEKKKMIMVTSEDLDKRYKDDEEDTVRYFSYADYQKEIEEGKISVDCIWFDNQKGSLAVYSGGFCQLVKGTVAKMENQKKVGDYTPAFAHEVQEYITVHYQYSGEQSYPLCDGNTVSVKDAVKFVEDHLNNEYPFYVNTELKSKVANMKVVEVKDGVYDYAMSVVPSYHEVKFDCDNMKYEEWGGGTLGIFKDGETSSDGKQYYIAPYQANVAKADQMDTIYGFDTNYDIKDEKKYDQILTLKEAFNISSKQLSKGLQLECSSAEFVYTRYNEKEDDDSPKHVNPEWKITTVNQKDHLYYYLYVNAVDGSFHYTMDQTEDENALVKYKK